MQLRARSRPGHGLDLELQPWLRSRSRPDCGLDLESWPRLRSRSRPGHRLDLKPCQIRSSGSRSNLWPGLDLDLSHGHAVAAALDLICGQV